MRDKSKVIALVALIVAVVGLGIGFAAFSSQLTISSGATVTPNKSDWNVEFVSGNCIPIGSGITIVSQPTVEGTTVSGMEVVFSGSGQLACNFQIQNSGKYTAYLTKMEFIENLISCEAMEEDDENFPEGYTRADDSLVSEACKTIDSRFSPFNGPDYVGFGININGDPSIASNNIWTINNVSDAEEKLIYSIASGGSIPATVVIHYGGTALADGPFIVKIPDLKLTFSTTPNVQ